MNIGIDYYYYYYYCQLALWYVKATSADIPMADSVHQGVTVRTLHTLFFADNVRTGRVQVHKVSNECVIDSRKRKQ